MEQKTKRDDRYIQFPLCLLQETYLSPIDGLNVILDYGIVNFAKKMDYTLTEVARQLMYAYYRNRNMIQDDLFGMLIGFIDAEALTTDEDYKGFSGPNFNPGQSIEELEVLFESHSEFKQIAIFRYQIAQAEHFLGVKDYNINTTIKNYNKGLSIKNNFERVYGPDCCPGIKPIQIIEFRDSGKDLELFQAYIGIKSLIGHNNYVSTHKTVILSRMLGCKSNESLTAFLKRNKKAKEAYDMYSGRKRMDNLLYKLMERGFVIVLSKKHESRIYVSAKLKTPAELADAILKNRMKNDLKKQIAEASKLL